MLTQRIKKLVLEEGYELVHTHTPIASFLTRLACREIPNLKMVYTAHGFHFFKGAPLKNFLIYYTMERILSKYTDAIITINQEDYILAKKFKLRKGNSVYKTHGIGVDLNKFSPRDINEKVNLRKEYGYKDNDVILFYAAELNGNKHQDLLINAINLLKDNVPNIRLLLAGNGNLREKYEEEVKRLGIQENVNFLGFRKDIARLLKMSDIAVASSRREGLPVNIMEAMATGLPLVVTNCRGQRDLVSNGINGFVIDLNDIEGFSNAVKEIYGSENLSEVFGGKSREIIKNYSLDNVLKEVQEVYSKVLKN